MPNYDVFRQGFLCQIMAITDMGILPKYGGCRVKRVGALEGYDTCHWVMELLTALEHSCILLSLIARRHEHAF